MNIGDFKSLTKKCRLLINICDSKVLSAFKHLFYLSIFKSHSSKYHLIVFKNVLCICSLKVFHKKLYVCMYADLQVRLIYTYENLNFNVMIRCFISIYIYKIHHQPSKFLPQYCQKIYWQNCSPYCEKLTILWPYCDNIVNILLQ